MSYSLLNSPLIKNDIRKATAYYKNISPELARQFLFRVREAKAYIARSPLGFQIKYSSVRTLMLKQFPYHIHYIIDDNRKLIIVIAVIHSYQEPTDYSPREFF
jgi:plasmid stabilization system protein ParE